MVGSRERETFGTFGVNPLYEAAQQPLSEKDLQDVLARIRAEKEAGSRSLPSKSLVSIGETPPDGVRKFLVDECARLVDQNWCGRSEMCVYFAVLLRHGLRLFGCAADVEVGKGQYLGAAQPFIWDHAWVRTSTGDLIDGNVDSLIENPVVPEGVNPVPYWGPAESLPQDRKLLPDHVLQPERDDIELDEHEITEWKAALDESVLEWRSQVS